jgi:coatomer protein complex subunit alpha (xenin)
MPEDAERIAGKLNGPAPEVPDEDAATLLLPPLPILREENWPLLTVSKGFFETLAAKGTAATGAAAAASAPGAAKGRAAAAAAEIDESALEGAGWGADDLDLGMGGGTCGSESNPFSLCPTNASAIPQLGWRTVLQTFRQRHT